MKTHQEGKPYRRSIAAGVFTAALTALLGSGCSVFLKASWDARRAEEREFSEDEMARLTKTTTVFFLRSADEPRRDEFEAALERVWHLTEIEVAPFARFSEYADTTKYSYLVIESESPTGFPVSFYYLTLLGLSPEEEGEEPDSVGYGRINLQSAVATMQLAPAATRNDRLAEVYRQGEFYNWTPALLATYLQSVQSDLERGQRRKMVDDFEDAQGMQRLREATLYVPEHLLIEFGDGSEEAKRLDPKELTREYPYRYEIIADDALDALVARSDTHEEPIFILDCVGTAEAKLVSIYEYGRGMIYRDRSIMGFSLSSGDFDVF